MYKLKINWLDDEYDCDTCGSSYAEGAIVYLDDIEILRLEPVAHCFGGKHWDREDVYEEIFKQLGYKICSV